MGLDQYKCVDAKLGVSIIPKVTITKKQPRIPITNTRVLQQRENHRKALYE